MPKEYDFSQAERGKFSDPDARIGLPIYLDPENLSFVQKIASKKDRDISTVVNDLIRSDRDIAEVIE